LGDFFQTSGHWLQAYLPMAAGHPPAGSITLYIAALTSRKLFFVLFTFFDGIFKVSVKASGR
jgi:hypothetical protein